jgi:ribosomal protein L11 methylase PrmA
LKPEGRACLSGLQQQDYGEIGEALGKAGLQISASMAREEWLAVEISRMAESV